MATWTGTTGNYDADSGATSTGTLYDWGNCSSTDTGTTSDWFINSDGSHYHGISTQAYTTYNTGVIEFPTETEKERAIRLFVSDLEQAEREEREEKRKAKLEAKKSAEEKAVRLLETLIGPQIEVYRKTGRVFVKGNNGTTYIVRKGRSLQKVEKNKIVDLCILLDPKYECPRTDSVIALKMLLEEDEDHVLKLANTIGTESLPEELPLAACM